MNIIDSIKLKKDIIWERLKVIRKLFVLKYCQLDCCEQYFPPRSLIKNNYIQENIEKLKVEFKVNSSVFTIHNMTERRLETAARMFTYLNICPDNLILFYRNLLKNSSAKQILLALTNIMKTSKNARKQIAAKIWIKFTEHFQTLYFDKIGSITSWNYGEQLQELKNKSKNLNKLGKTKL